MVRSEKKGLSSEIYVISDGTGETAIFAVKAALVQFDASCEVRNFGDVRQASEARELVQQAAKAGALVVFTLVDEVVCNALQDSATEYGVSTVDLLGPLIHRMAKHLRSEPLHRPGVLHSFSDEYFQRIDAVEFAVRHDDGANLHNLFEADVILTGVSRTSKTPLSMYLAQRGYKACNVPLVPGVDPPRELLEVDPAKVFGLTISPNTLLTIRETRERNLGASPYSSYSDPEEIQAELEKAKKLFRKQGWRVVDISGRAVEETATRIIHLLERPLKTRK